jgi:hypothetical protein
MYWGKKLLSETDHMKPSILPTSYGCTNKKVPSNPFRISLKKTNYLFVLKCCLQFSQTTFISHILLFIFQSQSSIILVSISSLYSYCFQFYCHAIVILLLGYNNAIWWNNKRTFVAWHQQQKISCIQKMVN